MDPANTTIRAPIGAQLGVVWAPTSVPNQAQLGKSRDYLGSQLGPKVCPSVYLGQIRAWFGTNLGTYEYGSRTLHVTSQNMATDSFADIID